MRYVPYGHCTITDQSQVSLVSENKVVRCVRADIRTFAQRGSHSTHLDQRAVEVAEAAAKESHLISLC